MAHARRDTPNEACGLIAGRGSVASRVIPCRNVASDPEHLYVVDPADLRMVIDIEDAGEDLVGIYHSHTRSGAYPSPTDRREARWPDSFYVLVSTRAEPPEVRAFRIKDHDKVSEAPIVES